MLGPLETRLSLAVFAVAWLFLISAVFHGRNVFFGG